MKSHSCSTVWWKMLAISPKYLDKNTALDHFARIQFFWIKCLRQIIYYHLIQTHLLTNTLYHLWPCSQNFFIWWHIFFIWTHFFSNVLMACTFSRLNVLLFFFAVLVLGKILFLFQIIHLRMFQRQGFCLLSFVEAFAESLLNLIIIFVRISSLLTQ